MPDLHAAVVAEIQKRIKVAWAASDPLGRTRGEGNPSIVAYWDVHDSAAMLRLYRADLALLELHGGGLACHDDDGEAPCALVRNRAEAYGVEVAQ